MQGVGELFKYLVSKQVESVDGFQSSFSQTHRAAKGRNTENYTTHNKQISLPLMHNGTGVKEYFAVHKSDNKYGILMQALIQTISVFQLSEAKNKKALRIALES